MKHFILLALIPLLLQPGMTYSEEATGSLEITVQYVNGDRLSPSEMVLQVYQDTHKDVFKTLDPPPSNPYYLTDLPLNHKYTLEVYVNSMYSGVGSVDLKTVDAKLELTIPPSGGFRFNVFYDDGVTPIEGAVVSVMSHDGNQWRQTTTDSEGKTLRFWLQSTTREGDYYKVSVSMGEHLVYDQTNIRLEPGLRKEVKVVTPWPSRVDQLIINIYKTPSEKLDESDGKIVAELHHPDGKVVESVVNRKGDAFFTNISVGDYTLRVFREREGFLYHLEEWGSMTLTLESTQLSMKFVRSEPFINGWEVSKEPYPPDYDRVFSSLISNLGSDARNVTVSLIFDRDQTKPYDIVKDLALSIPAESTKNLQVEMTPDSKGIYYTYMFVSGEKSVITDQISWQRAFDVTRVRPVSENIAITDTTPNALQNVPRSCNCVAFRLDDIQDHFTRDGQKDLINMFLKENAALTIGVIGGFLHDDKDLIQFLQNAVSSGPIEVANHSWNHKDHSAMTADEQKDSIAKTNEHIRELFGTEVKTFIPPENAFNNYTISIMKETGLTHLSGSVFVRADTPPYPLKNGDSVFHFPQTAYVSNVNATTGRWTISTNEQILEMIRTSIKQYGFAVVSMHPVAYYDKQNSTYTYHKETMEPLRTLLKEVKKEFNLVKISEIDEQRWIPKHPKETLITNFGAGHGFGKQTAFGTQIDDTKDFVMGTQSLKLTTDGDGQAVFTRKASISPSINFTGKSLKVWIKVNDTSKIDELRVTVTSDNFATFKNYRMYDDGVNFQDLQNNQWNEVTIMLYQSNDRGTPDISNINTIQLRVADKGNGPISVWFSGLALLELEDTLGDIRMSNHMVSWKGKDTVVASNAEVNVKVSDEKLFLEKTTDSWEEPFLMSIPKTMIPREPIVMAEEKILPTMSWFDSDSQAWLVYVDPPQSTDSVHVVPEFDLALLTLAFIFGFLLFMRIFRQKGLSSQHMKFPALAVIFSE